MHVAYETVRTLVAWGSLPVRWVLLLGVVGCLSIGAVHAQPVYQPEFDLDLMTVRADNESRVDVYAAVPYSSLRFLSQGGGFIATYTVTVDVYRSGRSESLVLNRQWDRRVTAATFQESRDNNERDVSTQAVRLAPGDYTVRVQVEDGASRRSFVREQTLRVRDLSGALAVSDPLLLDRYDASRQTLYPNVANVLRTDQASVTLYYEIYAAAPRRVQVRYEVERAPASREANGNRERRSTANGNAALAMERTEPLSIRAGKNPATLALSMDDLRVGSYLLRVRLQDDQGRVLTETQKAFEVRWMGLDIQLQDFDNAVSQLRYIAKEREIRAIRNAPTMDEKLRLFEAFWERRDPTPGTRRNERMEEYYYRVSFANERYGRFSERGWNTDRGEVFIRFGEPDFVETHPYNYGTKPYEVWYYNSIGRRYIFVDETGFGDYRLLVPIWDDRTRM